MKNENFIDFSWIINVITRRKQWMIGVAAVAVLGAILLVLVIPPRYKATTTLMIEPSESSRTNELNVLMAGERLALTYSHVINSRPVLEKAIASLNAELSASDLSGMVSVQPIENTQLVQVSVTDSTPDQAVDLVNAIASSFLAHIKNLSAENYNQTFNNYQKSIDNKQAEISAITENITAQNKKRSDLEAELTKLQLIQSQYRNDYLLLQQNYQNLELTTFEATEMIHIVEPAYVVSGSPMATVLIFFNRDILTGSVEITLRESDLIAQIYGPMLVRESLLAEVIDQLGLAETPASLAQRISYQAVAATQFLRLNVSGDDPAQTELIAQTIAEKFITQNQNALASSRNGRLSDLKEQMDALTEEMVQVQEKINDNSAAAVPIALELERLSDELSSKYADLRDLQDNNDQISLEVGRSSNTVVITEPAAQAKNQFKNNFIYAGILFFLIMVGGIGGIFLLENLDDKIRTLADITSLIESRPIGTIGHISRGKGKLVFESNSSPHVSEDFRKLSAIIRPILKDFQVNTLLITSPHSGEGKSLIASNLGLVFARTGSKVIIVDADLHLPRQHTIFDLSMENGFSDCLAPHPAEPALKPTRIPNLSVLTSGELPREPSVVLSTPYLEKIIHKLSDMADLVIIDCPPIVTLADASYLTPFVDGALLVLRSGTTRRKAALEAAAALKSADMKFFGTVLNDVIEIQDSFYHYYGAKPSETQD